MTNPNFFQVGGSLEINLPSYIERQADKDLYEHLQKGDFCYVLAARQMGKSSLSIRTINRLQEEDWAIALVDLTGFGSTGFNAEQWYYSFIKEIASMLNLHRGLKDWWKSHQLLTPVDRMGRFWEEIVLKNTTQKIAIFIDEIDAMMGIEKGIFRTNDFFAAIRSIYNKRAINSDYKRLNFSVFGVATPQDLMNSREGTPFNIGKEIKLLNFTPTEAIPLKKGFINSEEGTKLTLLNRTLYWTGGQPYLTQVLSQHLSKVTCTLEEVNNIVDNAAKSIFLRKDILNQSHFSNIQDRMMDDKNPSINTVLEIYQATLKTKTHKIKERGIALKYLMLSGLVQEHEDGLQASNYIYTQIFDIAWVKQAFGQLNRPIWNYMQEWMEGGRKNDDLLRGASLQKVEKWAKEYDLSDSEREYLEKSRINKVRKKQRQMVSGIVIFSSLLLGIFGFKNLEQAKEIQAGNKKIRIQSDSISKQSDSLLITNKNIIHQRDSISKQKSVIETQRDSVTQLKNRTDKLNIELENSLAKTEMILFKDYLTRYASKFALTPPECPETILDDMIEIAKDHPQKSWMQSKIRTIIKNNQQVCNKYISENLFKN